MCGQVTQGILTVLLGGLLLGGCGSSGKQADAHVDLQPDDTGVQLDNVGSSFFVPAAGRQ